MFPVVLIRGSLQCLLRSAHYVLRSSSPTNRSDHERIFPSQLDFFHLMADHTAFTLTQRILHPVQTDFDRASACPRISAVIDRLQCSESRHEFRKRWAVAAGRHTVVFLLLPLPSNVPRRVLSRCQAAKREFGWQCVEHAFASSVIQLVRNMASHHQHSSAVDLPGFQVGEHLVDSVELRPMDFRFHLAGGGECNGFC
jgi:hypothetical protein